MKLILFLAALFGAAYLFGNYHAFRPNIMQPVLVQINHARENNPQALCNLLTIDAKVTINDNIPRNKVSLTDVDKTTACAYFYKSAPLMLPNNPPRKNGFIPDILQNVTIEHEDITKDHGSVTFGTDERRREMRDRGTLLTGKTTTKLELKRVWLAGGMDCLFNSDEKPQCPASWSNAMQIKRMELTRNYDIIPE
ncbi:MAG: hypothetical protein Q4D61_07170 [Cardiobacteriaceae bacterium]|nr:hypothetical protein [Cardiobacteriaceae bacterium]